MPGCLFLVAICLLLGGAVLRFNGLIIGYTPSAGYVYFPSVIELLVSIGLLAVEVVGFTLHRETFPDTAAAKTHGGAGFRPGRNRIGAERLDYLILITGEIPWQQE